MIDRRFSWPGALIGLWAANSPRPCWHFRIIAFRLLHTLSHPLWHWNTFAFYTCLLSHFIPARLWVESCPRRLRPCAGLWPCTFCSDPPRGYVGPSWAPETQITYWLSLSINYRGFMHSSQKNHILTRQQPDIFSMAGTIDICQLRFRFIIRMKSREYYSTYSVLYCLVGQLGFRSKG